MYTVMITGGLGSGKSTLARLLCEHGAANIDLDEINRSLLVNNEAYIAELVDHFGTEILDEDGAVVPRELAQRAFSCTEEEQALNAIAFPYITDAATEYVLDVHCTPRHTGKILVVEVPLLTEVPEFAALADEVIAVNAISELRLRRAIERGMDAQDALRRLSLQPGDAERDAIADTICENNGSYEELAAWADAWWNERMEMLSK